YPRLEYIDATITDQSQQLQQIKRLILIGVWKGVIIWLVLVMMLYPLSKSITAWKTALLTLLAIIMMSSIALTLAAHYYILGTDKVGQDVFYLTVKSIRTGLIIGTITTMSMLPFALFLGI